MKLVVLILVSLLAAAQGRSLLASDEKPASPPYEVINSTKSVEIRKYENATWAVAFGRSRWSVDFAAHSAGLALFRYFKGGNVAHTEIDPTVPLVGTILRPPHHPHHHKNDSHHGPHHGGNGTHNKPHHKPHHPPGPPAVALAAYIPAKFEGNAPIPDCPQVKVVKTNSTEVYVHKFGGWAISWVVQHEIKHLELALKDLKICPKKGKFFVATYDGPWKIFGRHNEILWSKAPKHGHHNDSLAEEGNILAFNSGLRGMEIFDVMELFPEEFPVPEQLKMQEPISEQIEDMADQVESEVADLTIEGSDELDGASNDVQTY